MANFLERLVISGARTISPSRPPGTSHVTPPAAMFAAQEHPVEFSSTAPPDTFAVSRPHDGTTIAARHEPELLHDLPADRTVTDGPEMPPRELPKFAVTAAPQAFAAQPEAMRVETAELSSEPVESAERNMETPLRHDANPLLRQHDDIIPAAKQNAAPPEPPASPQAPSPMFRFQQPPVRVEGPRAMRPPKVSLPDTPVNAAANAGPPEPISLRFPQASVNEPTVPRQPASTMAREVSHDTPQPRVSASVPALPATATPREKRISIGSVELHVHEPPPSPKPASRPAAPPSDAHDNGAFERLGLERFAIRL